MPKNSNKTHPYIEAQKNKKRSNQGISSSCYNHHHNHYRNHNNFENGSRRNRKRKFIDTFEDDEQGRYEYNQSLIITPPSKKHISQEKVMNSIR